MQDVLKANLHQSEYSEADKSLYAHIPSAKSIIKKTKKTAKKQDAVLLGPTPTPNRKGGIRPVGK